MFGKPCFKIGGKAFIFFKKKLAFDLNYTKLLLIVHQTSGMKYFYSLLFFSFIFLNAYAQLFTAVGAAIPDNGSIATCFPVSVSGVGNISGTYGLASVCLNIKHSWDADLELKLKAPDGTIVALSLNNGNGDDNYTNTCFTATASILITNGIAPFSGNYLSQGNLGAVNNGQNADGIWYLCIKDIQASDTGHLVNFSINFNNTPATPAAVCTSNLVAGNTCALATLICNYLPYCGNTSSTYTTNTWPQLTSNHCGGTIVNNSFFKFVADVPDATFKVIVNTSSLGNGIKFNLYHGGCGTGSVVVDACNPAIIAGLPTLVTATALVPGNIYYIMLDGFVGDVCNYVLIPISGVAQTSPPPVVTGPVNYCQGATAVALSNVAVGQTLFWYNDSIGGTGTAIAPIPNTAVVGSDTFWVSQTSGCNESIRKSIIVNVAAAYASIATNDTTICWGTNIPIHFLGSPYSIFTYTINGSNIKTGTFGADSTLILTPIGNLFGTTVYKLVNVQLINSPACMQYVNDSLIINVLPKPVASIKYIDSIVCSASALALPAIISGITGGIFSAIPNGLNINASTGYIIPNLSSPGIYTVTYAYNGTGLCSQVILTTTTKVNIVSPTQQVWIGAVSPAWENPSNWSCGNLPDNNANVIITQGNIIISSNVTINSLTISSNVVLTVAAGYHLTILH
jgi:subtilisin-like proprotein convertase family protein